MITSFGRLCAQEEAGERERKKRHAAESFLEPVTATEVFFFSPVFFWPSSVGFGGRFNAASDKTRSPLMVPASFCFSINRVFMRLRGQKVTK